MQVFTLCVSVIKIVGGTPRLVAADAGLPRIRHHRLHPDLHHARRVRAVVRGLVPSTPIWSLHLYHVL
jgi:hypothetical protein